MCYLHVVMAVESVLVLQRVEATHLVFSLRAWAHARVWLAVAVYVEE